MSVRVCHPQNPGGPTGCNWLLLRRSHWPSPSPPRLGIHSATPVGSRVICVTGRTGSLALRPTRLLALHQHRTFTIELSPAGSPRTDVDYNYAGKQPIPAAGLAPARHTALWAANGDHGEEDTEKEGDGRSDRTSDQLQRSGCPRASTDSVIWVELALSSVLQAWRRLFFQQGSQAAICVTSISLNLSAVVIAWCPLGVTR